MSQLKSNVYKEYITYGLAQRTAILAKYQVGDNKLSKIENVFKASDLLGLYDFSSKNYDMDLHFIENKILSVTSDDGFMVKDFTTNKTIFTTKNDKTKLLKKMKEYGIGLSLIHI